MEVLEMFIDEQNEEAGVEAVSLVEYPAIESDFIALKKQGKALQLATVDDDKQILMGPALIPDKKILRADKNPDGSVREYEIFFSKETIRKAQEVFFKRGYQNNTTEEHEVQLQGNTVVESWIKEDMSQDKSALYGLDVPVGTWMISLKVGDRETYLKAKQGEVKGFSIEGYFVEQHALKSHKKPTDSELLEKIRQIIG